MARVWRLRPHGEFERVHRGGHRWPHRLLGVIAQARDNAPHGQARIAVAAGRKLGKAVVRNRLKRRMRAAIQQVYSHLRPDIDLIVIARAPMIDAGVADIAAALTEVLQRAQLWETYPPEKSNTA